LFALATALALPGRASAQPGAAAAPTSAAVLERRDRRSGGFVVAGMGAAVLTATLISGRTDPNIPVLAVAGTATFGGRCLQPAAAPPSSDCPS
jgi:hypothetical protein